MLNFTVVSLMSSLFLLNILISINCMTYLLLLEYYLEVTELFFIEIITLE